jgi:hypothetical protein
MPVPTPAKAVRERASALFSERTKIVIRKLSHVTLHSVHKLERINEYVIEVNLITHYHHRISTMHTQVGRLNSVTRILNAYELVCLQIAMNVLCE